jgi:DNA-binding transcriptional ArsR family regulator
MKAEYPKNRFGSRLDAGTAKVDDLIGKRPLTTEQIEEENRKLHGRETRDAVYEHLNSLYHEGYVEKTEDGKWTVNPKLIHVVMRLFTVEKYVHSLQQQVESLKAKIKTLKHKK